MNSVAEALNIARSAVGTSEYWLGTGDAATPLGGRFDCFGFAFNKCYGVRRHRPGFNSGPWATVSDDLNCNSAIEDAQHKQELFQEVTLGPVLPGDLLVYPSFYLKDAAGGTHKYIGHIAIVNAVPDKFIHYSDLTVIQCCGPNGRKPGILHTSGAHWDQHDHVWPKPEHRTRILRPKQ